MADLAGGHVIIGHERALQAIRHARAWVILLQGPAHVGKKTIAAAVLRERPVAAADTLWLPRLTADGAREAIRFALTAPLQGARAVVACLDAAPSQALNALLKVLEEPPATCLFVLTASRASLPTIYSRSLTIPFGLLTDEQVAQVLVRTGMDAAAAARLAPAGAGQVRPAMLAAVTGDARGRVVGALKAASSGDQGAVDRLLRGWDDVCGQLLSRWAWEASMRRWRVFDAATVPVSAAEARNVVAVLGTFDRARPELAAQAALTSLVQHRVMKR